MSPEEVAREYFRRMQEADPSVFELYADDAEILGNGQRVEGRAAIAEFYGYAQREAKATPEILAVVAQGDLVLAEAFIHLEGGLSLHVVDRFEIRDDQIQAMTFFVAEYPANGDPPA